LTTMFCRFFLGFYVAVSSPGCGRFNFDIVGSTEAQDAAPDDANDEVANLAFVTTTTYNGNLGGVEGANALCNEQATVAGLVGDFVAVPRSTDQDDPTIALAGSTGWKSIAGKWVFETREQVNAAEPINALTNARGYIPTTWSGSGGNSCTGWTDASVGSIGGTKTWRAWGSVNDIGQANAGPRSCDEFYALSCFERGRQATRRQPAIDQRLIFVSRTTWQPQQSGRASADALCNREAAGANRAGQFVALLPVNGESALSRIPDAATTVFQRGNGEPFMLSYAPQTFLLEDASGASIPISSYYAWTGGYIDSATKPNCSSWQNPGEIGAIGNFHFFGNNYYDGLELPCTNAYHVYCVQQ
jgi:hypothetical protein